MAVSGEDWPQVPIEVKAVKAPNGKYGVLLQLPDGYVVMGPESARVIGATIDNVALEAETLEADS